MDTYCWIHSTFTLPKLLYADVGEEVSNPGVGPVGLEDEIVEHKYYQWVCFTLFLQVKLSTKTLTITQFCSRAVVLFCPTPCGRLGRKAPWPTSSPRMTLCTKSTTPKCQGENQKSKSLPNSNFKINMFLHKCFFSKGQSFSTSGLQKVQSFHTSCLGFGVSTF